MQSRCYTALRLTSSDDKNKSSFVIKTVTNQREIYTHCKENCKLPEDVQLIDENKIQL